MCANSELCILLMYAMGGHIFIGLGFNYHPFDVKMAYINENLGCLEKAKQS